MRNASALLTTFLIAALLLASACTEEHRVVVRSSGEAYLSQEVVDSATFRRVHHYWKNHQFKRTDGSTTTIVDVALYPAMYQQSEADSVWLCVATVEADSVSLDWLPEHSFLHENRPHHALGWLFGLGQKCGLCGTLLDVPGGEYSSEWLEYYLHPTLNPWSHPVPIALFVLLLWLLPVLLIGLLLRFVIFPVRYRCGHCHGPLRRLGRCPHCGAMNI